MNTPVKDRQTVTPEGDALQPLLDGMSFRDVPLHVDDRGHLCEIYDERWAWHDAPLSYVYFSSVRPGVIKGWALHERHEDRNVGTTDCVIVNLPSLPFDHADPDKFRLPIDTDEIPYSFGDAAQGW